MTEPLPITEILRRKRAGQDVSQLPLPAGFEWRDGRLHNTNRPPDVDPAQRRRDQLAGLETAELPGDLPDMDDHADPNWNEDVQWQVQKALNDLIRASADIKMRHADPTGAYVQTHVSVYGGVDGLMHSGFWHVIKPLQDQLAATLAAFREVDEKIAEHRGRPPVPPHPWSSAPD
jgi:hypothetical protein